MTSVAKLWDPARIGDPILEVAGTKKVSIDMRVLAGASKEIFSLDKPGTITAIRFAMSKADEAAVCDAWIQIRFDGATVPQVEAPLGCFFGVYRTQPSKRIASRFVGCKGSDMYCYLPMPFWRSATVSLLNRGTSSISNLHADLSFVPRDRLPYPKELCAYFHAVYHRESPRTEGHDYRYADLRGQGQIVGHFTYRTNTSMEEDERTYFDDSRTPAVYGEGFEDDHNQGWGLRDLQQAIYGSTASDGGSGAPWRFFTPDLYVFNSHVRHGHQVYGPNSPLGHEGMYQVGNEESVTFLYARERESLIQTDEFDPGNPESEKQHAYRVFGSRQNKKGRWWYDGEENNVLFKLPPISDDGISTDRGSQFRVKIDPSNEGIRIRRRTDKDNNRQLANVYIDGVRVSERPWYNVDFERIFRDIRWYDSDFEIPARYTRGKRNVTIRIDFVSSKLAHWDEFRYWIYSYR